MRVVILAAGIGSRLHPYTKDIPKCLIKIGERRLLEYTLKNFSRNGLKDIIIVTGYKSEKFFDIIGNDYCGCNIEYIINENYLITDNMYSLWLTKSYVNSEFMYINADVLFHNDILSDLQKNNEQNLCVVDNKASLGIDEMKVRIKNNSITDFKRGLLDADARAIGLYKFSKTGAISLFHEIDIFIEQGKQNLKIERALIRFIAKNKLSVQKINNLPWAEIDNSDDLNKVMLLKNIYE